MSALVAARRAQATSGAPAENLAREAEAIHRILFGCAASEELKRRYAAALASAPDGAPRHCEWRFDTEAELEAIEFALRRKNPFNPLTQRFRVVSYLAEVEPAFFDRFVTERRQFWAGVGALVRAVLRTIYLGVKGARHGLG